MGGLRQEREKEPAQKRGKLPEVEKSLGLVALDRNGNITSCNRRFEELFQFGRCEVVGCNLDKVLRKPKDEKDTFCFTDLEKGGKIVQGYGKRQRKDGKWIEIEFFSLPPATQIGNTGPLIFYKDLTQFKQSEEFLRRRVISYETILQTALDGFFITNVEGKILKANRAASEIYGYSQEELIGRNILDFKMEKMSTPTRRDLARQYGFDRFETKHRRSDGRVVDLQFCINFVEMGDDSFFFCFFHDITHLRQAIHSLQERERDLEVKSNALQEANTALKVLLERREKDRQALEEKVLCNIKELVLPYLQRIKGLGLNKRQIDYLRILEQNLHDVISPFTQTVSSRYLGLTPAELRVADLVRHGRSTKEIAEMMNLSVETVKSHRHAIRKKLHIRGRKVNLRTTLLSMKE